MWPPGSRRPQKFCGAINSVCGVVPRSGLYLITVSMGVLYKFLVDVHGPQRGPGYDVFKFVKTPTNRLAFYGGG